MISGRKNRVVPLGQFVVSLDGEFAHLGIRNLVPLLVGLLDEMSPDPQTCGGFGSSEIVEDRLMTVQRTPSPVLADFAEETVLNGIPLRRPRRVMGDFYGESMPVA